MYRATGDRSGEAICHHQRALEMFLETGNPTGQSQALNGLGEAFLKVGRAAEARLQHTGALQMARKVGDQYEQARAHHGLGHASRVLGHPDLSPHHWGQALDLYTRLGVPEAGEVRAQLAGMLARS